MSRLKIAIACQGGGSQTAFTAGALKTLCEEQIGQDFDVVGISGTSGGAVCATLLWYSYLKGERPIWTRMMEFWKDNTAQGAIEHAINQFIVGSLRLVNSGMMPTFQISPSSPAMQIDDAVYDRWPAQGLFRFSRAAGNAHRLRGDRLMGAATGAAGPDLGAANVKTGALVNSSQVARRSASSTSSRRAPCRTSFRRCRSVRMPIGMGCFPTTRRSRS